jgi:hypothetical protein
MPSLISAFLQIFFAIAPKSSYRPAVSLPSSYRAVLSLHYTTESVFFIILSGVYSPTILDLGTRWRRVVRITPLPFTRGMCPQVLIGQETSWASEPIWTLWRREKYLASTRNRNPGRQAGSLVATPTELSRL